MSHPNQTPPAQSPEKPIPVLIQVLSDFVDEFSGVAKATGRPYTIRRQSAFILNDGQNAYPTKFTLYLRDTEPPHAKGWYCLLPQSFDVDENKNLIIRPKLMLIDDPRHNKG